MCPAITLASLRMRLLLPLSVLPTMFVMALPIIACPLMWCQYVLLWQVTPSYFLKLGIFCLCWQQMANAFSTIWFKMEEPTSRAYLNVNLKKTFALNTLVALGMAAAFVIGIAIIGYSLISVVPFEWLKWGLEAAIVLSARTKMSDVINGARLGVVILSKFIAVFFFKWWLSKVAAYDFVMSQVSADHETKVCINQMRKFRQDISEEDLQKDPNLRKRVAMVDQAMNQDTEATNTLSALVDLRCCSRSVAIRDSL